MKKLFIVFICILITSLTYAKTVTFPKEPSLFSIETPEGWSFQIHDYILYMTPYDESIYVGSWTLPDEIKMENAVSSANEIIGDIISEPQLNAPQNTEFNGITFSSIEGKGRDKITDKPINISASFFSPDKKKVFILLYFWTPEFKQKYDSEVTAMIKSIKAIKS